MARIIIADDDPIIVEDNGSGMKTAEVRDEYLNIASPRWTRKGEKTPNKNRLVKGRRGVGKFAGLILASRMELEATAFGFTTRVEVDKELLLRDSKDLEQVQLPFSSKEVDSTLHGTRIILSRLNPNLNLPQPDRFKQILARDYGRETDFVILVNGERVFAFDVPGTTFECEIPETFRHLLPSEPTLGDGSDYAELMGMTILRAPAFTIRGGTREILRGMIARGLGLR